MPTYNVFRIEEVGRLPTLFSGIHQSDEIRRPVVALSDGGASALYRPTIFSVSQHFEEFLQALAVGTGITATNT
jgi:hypothetical protein